MTYQSNPSSMELNVSSFNLNALEEMIKKLENELFTISNLFNDVSLPFKLWELGLCLIHYSGLNAPDAAKKLWRSVIYRYRNAYFYGKHC
jgi:hypothetical protein